MAVCYPAPRHAVEAYGEDWIDPEKIITNGPYMLEYWSDEDTISFVRNRQYHGKYKGNVNQVNLIVRDWPPKSENLHTYESGEADVLNLADVPVTVLNSALQRHIDEYVIAPELMSVIHGFNVRKPPFDKTKVRQAFALSFNQEELVNKFVPGWIIPATGGFIPPGMPGHSPGIGLPYDPQRARQMLAEAGYPGGKKLPPIVATTFPGHNELSAYIIQQWERILGIEISEEVLEWDLLINRLNEDPPQLWLGLGFVTEYPDPDALLRVGFPWNETGWRNETCRRLIEKARTAINQDERIRLYAEAERIMMNEAAIIPMTYSRRLFLIKPWVKKYPLSAMRDSYWKDVIIEPH
jgi:oligopeptide transport system substrate-binding protein